MLHYLEDPHLVFGGGGGVRSEFTATSFVKHVPTFCFFLSILQKSTTIVLVDDIYLSYHHII